MPTYTVLADAYNYMRKNELADRPEHVTVRKGETVELDADAAAAGVESGALTEGEVDADAYLAEQEAAKQAEAQAAATDDAAAEEGAPSSGRRRR